MQTVATGKVLMRQKHERRERRVRQMESVESKERMRKSSVARCRVRRGGKRGETQRVAHTRTRGKWKELGYVDTVDMPQSLYPY